MDERLLFALAYTVPGALVALVAMHAGFTLSAKYDEIVNKAAEAQRDVPSLVTLYFKQVSRVLVVGSLLFLVLLSGDGVLSHVHRVRWLLQLLGYAGGIVLLVCSFALLLHGMADRQLKLQPKWWRLAYICAGVVGVALAAYGMAVVTWHESLWAG